MGREPAARRGLRPPDGISGVVDFARKCGAFNDARTVGDVQPVNRGRGAPVPIKTCAVTSPGTRADADEPPSDDRVALADPPDGVEQDA